MSQYQYPGKIVLTILLLLVGSSAIGQKKVGQVSDVDMEAWVERDGDVTELSQKEPFNLGDTLFVEEYPDNNKLTLLFENDEGEKFDTIELGSGGKVSLSGDNSSSVICDFVGGNHLIKGKPCKGVYRDGVLVVNQTIYEVDIRAKSTRLFVYEGSVSVYSNSTNPEHAEPRHVHAGEWVRFSKGEPIPKPQKFTMAIGPGSGSTECIHSDCKLVNNVLIPERPVVTPSVLIPPPPNPPGRR